jgi:23S rRNA (uracil1939-C5)-methyltransferase
MSKRRKQLSTALVTAQIEKFSHDGRGIARIDGKTTFIAGSLPQETVTFQYRVKKRDYDEGVVVTVLDASPKRVDPHCPHFVMCGGCSLQHLEADAQIYEKEALLLDLLNRIGHCQPDTILRPLASSSWHYRNKARLSVRYVEKKQATLIGFREKNNPRYITDITQCSVLNSHVDAQLLPLRALIDSFDDPHAIAQIEVAAGDKEVALIFRNLSALTAEDEEKIRVFANASAMRIFLQPAGPDSVYLFYPDDGRQWLTYALPQYQVEFQFFPTDFTQVNAGLNRLMIDKALTALDLQADDVVLDLFCGLGNFSLPLARFSRLVVGVEGTDAMVMRARTNAHLNGILNTEFFCKNLEETDALDGFPRHRYTKVLLDPPRTGAFEIVKQINKINPERIVYVSCNPATLARDADILIHQHGYRMLAAGVMDMFPHTSHVESMAVFIR